MEIGEDDEELKPPWTAQRGKLTGARCGNDKQPVGYPKMNAIDWLLESGPWISWQAMRDLTDAVPRRSRRAGRASRVKGLARIFWRVRSRTDLGGGRMRPCG